MPNDAKTNIDHQVAFMRFLQGKAIEPGTEGRYMLGKKIGSIPITYELINAFVEQRNGMLGANPGQALLEQPTRENYKQYADNLGLISPVGLESGKVEYRVNYPFAGTNEQKQQLKKINTASVVPLQFEMETHLGLIFECTYKAIIEKNPNLTHDQRQQLKTNLDGVKLSICDESSRKILIDQIKWLEKKGVKADDKGSQSNLESEDSITLSERANELFRKYIEKAGDKGYEEFNSYLNEQRPGVAKALGEQSFAAMQLLGVLNTGGNSVVWQDIKPFLKKTPSTTSDRLVENSATGLLQYTSATEHTAHDKQAGHEHLALVKIVTSNGDVFWRVPSISPTDDKSLSHEDRVKDVKGKLGFIADTITDAKNGGTSGHCYYNLLTSYGQQYKDNKQSESTEAIIQAVHQYNAEKLEDTKNYILLSNISINQFGIEKGSEGIVPNEIYHLVDLSVLQAIASQLSDVSGVGISAGESERIQTAANATRVAYESFLADPGRPIYYAQSDQLEQQKDAIKELRAGEVARASAEQDTSKETPAQKAAKVLYRMFLNDTYGKREFGPLVQSLMLTVETNKFGGCKSANERFASVLDKAMQVGEKECLKALDQFANGEIDENQLYTVVLDLYNRQGVYEGAGQDISYRDQSSGAKTEHFGASAGRAAANVETALGGIKSAVSEERDRTATLDEEQLASSRDYPDDASDYDSESEAELAPNEMSATMKRGSGAHKSSILTYNTNAFESPAVTRLKNSQEEKLQAHKVKGKLANAFEKGAKNKTNLESQIGNLKTEVGKYVSSHPPESKSPGDVVNGNGRTANLTIARSFKTFKDSFKSMVGKEVTPDDTRVQKRLFAKDLQGQLERLEKQLENPANLDVKSLKTNLSEIRETAEGILQISSKTELHGMAGSAVDLCNNYEKIIGVLPEPANELDYDSELGGRFRSTSTASQP